MKALLDLPTVMGILIFLFLWAGTALTVRYVHGRAPRKEAKQDFGVVLAAVLTLLGLVIGFTFSMAISRYDLRKNYEEAEANAIGTEYVRADLLPAADAAKLKQLLTQYTAQRIMYYASHSENELQQIAAGRARLQEALWAAVLPAARAQPTPLMGLVVSGMNDVLNSQGYTHAAWINRIPVEAWVLLVLLALLSNMMITYSANSLRNARGMLLILPLVVAVSFMMIADIDAPRHGLVQVAAPNLKILLAGMH